MIKAVFLDRDGTINVERDHVYRIEDFELLPGVIEALKLLTLHKIKIFIVTNQAGIAKGYYSEDQFRGLTEYIANLLEKEGITLEKTLYCPHHPEGCIPEYTKACECRKPNTELVEEVMTLYSYRCDEVAVIGDKNSDIEMGQRLGARTYLVLTGYGRDHKNSTHAENIADNLLDAVHHLLGDNEIGAIDPQEKIMTRCQKQGPR